MSYRGREIRSTLVMLLKISIETSGEEDDKKESETQEKYRWGIRIHKNLISFSAVEQRAKNTHTTRYRINL